MRKIVTCDHIIRVGLGRPVQGPTLTQTWGIAPGIVHQLFKRWIACGLRRNRRTRALRGGHTTGQRQTHQENSQHSNPFSQPVRQLILASNHHAQIDRRYTTIGYNLAAFNEQIVDLAWTG